MSYLETANLKLALDTGLAWRIRRDPDGDDAAEFLGPIEDDDRCPVELADEWEYLWIEWADACRCAAADERTVDAAYFGRHNPAGWD